MFENMGKRFVPQPSLALGIAKRVNQVRYLLAYVIVLGGGQLYWPKSVDSVLKGLSTLPHNQLRVTTTSTSNALNMDLTQFNI